MTPNNHNTMNPDSTLMEQIAQDSVKAYKMLFLRYYPRLRQYACLYVTDDEADDVVQELMIALWEGRKFIQFNQSVSAYLFMATKNRCLSHIRKNEAIERKHCSLFEEIRDQFEDPDFYLCDELHQLITKSVAELPEEYRVVFEMSRFGGKTNTLIATELGLSVKTIEYRMTKSLKILRVKLSDYLFMIVLLSLI